MVYTISESEPEVNFLVAFSSAENEWKQAVWGKEESMIPGDRLTVWGYRERGYDRSFKK